MSIDDLFNFCLKNQMTHFEQNDEVNEIAVRMPAKFTFSDDAAQYEGLRPFNAAAYHDNINLNHTEISEENLVKTLPSAMLRPVLANVVEQDGELDFGSHDFYEDEDGKIIYEESPIGVIFGENTIEYDEKAKVNRAILHGFLFEGYCQDAIDILERRGGQADCSVELCIRAMSFDCDNQVLSLDDFYVSGLTLLGATVAPGMKGSHLKLADFSADTQAVCAKVDNTKLVETLESFNNTENVRKEDIVMGEEENVNFEANEETPELTEVQGETVVEEVTETTPEETEGESAEFEADDNEPESEPEVFRKEFAREVSHEEVRYGLYQLLGQFEELDNEWYDITSVFDEYFIMTGWSTGNSYGQKYTVEDGNVAFVGERYRLFVEYLTESELAELNSMRANYAAIAGKLAKYEEAEELADKMTVFEDESFAQFIETDEFKELMSEETLKKFSKEELADKANLAFSKLVKKNGCFSMQTNVEPHKDVALPCFDKPMSFLDKVLNK